MDSSPENPRTEKPCKPDSLAEVVVDFVKIIKSICDEVPAIFKTQTSALQALVEHAQVTAQFIKVTASFLRSLQLVCCLNTFLLLWLIFILLFHPPTSPRPQDNGSRSVVPVPAEHFYETHPQINTRDMA